MVESMVLTVWYHSQWLEQDIWNGSTTLSHCGTGNAGEGSKHLVNTKATLITTSPRLTSFLAIVGCLSQCDVCL
jgi:hypothetical protein